MYLFYTVNYKFIDVVFRWIQTMWNRLELCCKLLFMTTISVTLFVFCWTTGLSAFFIYEFLSNIVTFSLQGWSHLCLWCQSGHSNGNCSNWRTDRSFQDARRSHGDHWQSEADAVVKPNWQWQAKGCKRRVSESTQICTSRLGMNSFQNIFQCFLLTR